MRKIIILLVLSVCLTSCFDKGKIKVQNKVHNSQLEDISFGKLSIYSALLPGQTSTEIEVTEKKHLFPIIHQLEFYMVSNGNRVYLKTRENFRIEAGETLLITISDTTAVINPMLE